MGSSNCFYGEINKFLKELIIKRRELNSLTSMLEDLPLENRLHPLILIGRKSLSLLRHNSLAPKGNIQIKQCHEREL